MTVFVATLAEDGQAFASIRTYLSADRHHIANGFGDPKIFQMPHLEYVLKGIKLEGALNHSIGRSKGRQPLTLTSMRQLFYVWRKHLVVWDAKMLWAASCLAFFGFLRVEEFTFPTGSSFDRDVHLSLNDVSIDNPADPRMLFIR